MKYGTESDRFVAFYKTCKMYKLRVSFCNKQICVHSAVHGLGTCCNILFHFKQWTDTFISSGLTQLNDKTDLQVYKTGFIAKTLFIQCIREDQSEIPTDSTIELLAVVEPEVIEKLDLKTCKKLLEFNREEHYDSIHSNPKHTIYTFFYYRNFNEKETKIDKRGRDWPIFINNCECNLQCIRNESNRLLHLSFDIILMNRDEEDDDDETAKIMKEAKIER